MKDDGSEPLGGSGKTVEADETYFGNVGKNRRRYRLKADGTGWQMYGGAASQKWKVVALVKRDGCSRAKVVNFITANAVRDILVRNVDRKSDLRRTKPTFTRR